MNSRSGWRFQKMGSRRVALQRVEITLAYIAYSNSVAKHCINVSYEFLN